MSTGQTIIEVCVVLTGLFDFNFGDAGHLGIVAGRHDAEAEEAGRLAATGDGGKQKRYYFKVPEEWESHTARLIDAMKLH